MGDRITLNTFNVVLKVACKTQSHLTTSETPRPILQLELVEVLAGADRLQWESVELLMHGVVTLRTRFIARRRDVNQYVGDRMPSARRTVGVYLKTRLEKTSNPSTVEASVPST
ncbi:hypothetical protein P0D92_19700 [Pseudomonas sp. CBSPAW29]|nr:hypothetical protein P0D92_19700 [Pseudomonas sp. CBSPAW29]